MFVYAVAQKARSGIQIHIDKQWLAKMPKVIEIDNSIAVYTQDFAPD
jgi:hypothetical protein